MLERPDVALVSAYPPQGLRHAGHSGVASYTANLAEALAVEGLQVAVVAQHEAEPSADAGDDGPVRVVRAYRRGPGGPFHAVRTAERTGAPLVHVQHEYFLYGGATSSIELGFGLRRARRNGVRNVITLHQAIDPGIVDRDFVRMHGSRLPAAVSRRALGRLQRSLRRGAEATVVHEPVPCLPDAAVVPHGVESLRSTEFKHSRPAFGLDDRLAVLCFGFLAPYKGLECALEAARLAPDTVQLVVAGGDHPRWPGYGAALRSRWDGVAHFLGRIPEGDLPALFGAVDVSIFCYPRPFSASGAAALALGYGAPMLLSRPMIERIGAPDAAIAPSDPGELALRLRKLALDRSSLQELREASRLMARDRSWPSVARHHIRIYEEVLRDVDALGGRVRAG